MTTTKFKVDTATFKQALSTVSIVEPRPVGADGSVGYLFAVSGQKCAVYSRTGNTVARVQFDIHDVEGEGQFAFPHDNIKGFNFYSTGEITFEATSEGNKYRVSATGSDRKGVKAPIATFAPTQMRPCDREFKATKEGVPGVSYSSLALKQGLALAGDFRPEDKGAGNDEARHTIQIFSHEIEGKPVAGTLFATDGASIFYYQCEDFAGKPLEIHVQHVGLLQKFLDKSPGRVTIYRGPWNYAENSLGQVIGWTNTQKKHASYQYYSLELDQYILNVDQGEAVTALNFLSTQIGDGQKVRLNYADGKIQFEIAETGEAKGVTTWEVDAEPNKDSKLTEPFSLAARLTDFKRAFKSVSESRQVFLRIAYREDEGRRRAQIRVIDESVEAEESCKAMVTRFIPPFE